MFLIDTVMRRVASAGSLFLFNLLLVPMALAQGLGTSATSDAAFNPAVSLILNGQYGAYSNREEVRDVPGFQLGGEAASFTEGFTLNESELNLSANVDDKFYGAATIAFGYDAGETEVEVEEAYFQTLALPAGLQVKGGRFYSGIGYINGIHNHGTSFVDDPLPYRALFGGRLVDAGVQVTWTAPTLLYMQFGAELLAGDGFPAAGGANRGVGTRSLFAKFGGDFNVSNSWLASLSYVTSDAVERASGGTAESAGVDPLFTGSSDTMVGSLVWKWAPNGNNRVTNVRLTAEYLSRSESGELALAPETGRYDGDQSGYYLEGVYRFRSQWSVGVRYDALDADNTIAGITPPLVLADDTGTPKRITAMFSFQNSEFSKLRLQVVRDESNPVKDDQVILQYIMSVGAHGAHAF